MRTRHGKQITGGHHSRIDGLSSLLSILEGWPEITSIRLGRLARRQGRMGMANAGGGLRFTARRWVYQPHTDTRTAIKCVAERPGMMQEVYLLGSDWDALLGRLTREGFVAEFWTAGPF